MNKMVFEIVIVMIYIKRVKFLGFFSYVMVCCLRFFYFIFFIRGRLILFCSVNFFGDFIIFDFLFFFLWIWVKEICGVKSLCIVGCNGEFCVIGEFCCNGEFVLFFVLLEVLSLGFGDEVVFGIVLVLLFLCVLKFFSKLCIDYELDYDGGLGWWFKVGFVGGVFLVILFFFDVWGFVLLVSLVVLVFGFEFFFGLLWSSFFNEKELLNLFLILFLDVWVVVVLLLWLDVKLWFLYCDFLLIFFLLICFNLFGIYVEVEFWFVELLFIVIVI